MFLYFLIVFADSNNQKVNHCRGRIIFNTEYKVINVDQHTGNKMAAAQCIRKQLSC